MDYNALVQTCLQRKSFLCIGLDPEPSLIPGQQEKGPEEILPFLKGIVDATREYTVAYKLNMAFYEVFGAAGWELLQETVRYIGPEYLVIADGKRGDIGNTSRKYAEAVFHSLGADGQTVNPYMGKDAVIPFLEFPGKWVILLGLTSNPGSYDFQLLTLEGGIKLYQEVIRKAASWGSIEQIMFVVGATHPDELGGIRRIIPNHFILVPGVGNQGGDLSEVSLHGLNETIGLLVNAGRSVLYAKGEGDYQVCAAREARSMQQAMAQILAERGF